MPIFSGEEFGWNGEYRGIVRPQGGGEHPAQGQKDEGAEQQQEGIDHEVFERFG